MSFKFDIGLTWSCEDFPESGNPRNRDGFFVKLAWVASKELGRMGVVGLGLFTYDCKSI
jgi:hypothetical protein